MKIERKRGIKKIKIEHNKTLLLVIILLIVVLAILIFFIVKNKNKDVGCKIDSDCVPGGCCHPSSCVLKEEAPVCDLVVCTQECSGPLDCGAGSCGCVDGNCQIIPSG